MFNGQSLIVAVVRDLTQREAAAAALQASEQRQRLVAKVFENSNEGVVITDGIARIIEVNPAFSRITGYAPHEVIGKTPNVLSRAPRFRLLPGDVAPAEGGRCVAWRDLESAQERRGLPGVAQHRGGARRSGPGTALRRDLLRHQRTTTAAARRSSTRPITTL